MFCPKCEYEFMGGVLICPECHMTLVEKPSGSSAAVSPDDSWIEVCGVRTNSKADLAKKALDASNIPSVLLSERFMADHAVPEVEFAVPGSGEITVIMVPREFRDDAEMVVEVVLGDDLIPLDGE